MNSFFLSEFDISAFKDKSVLVVGDMMIDEYLWGDVDRISPEAPVQIVSIKKENFTLGGAGNVVNNLVSLGANVIVAGVAGQDNDSNILIDQFNKIGIDTQGIIIGKNRPTTKKTRIIAASQHVLRIDRETKKEISKNTFSCLSEFIYNNIHKADVILLSDYGKGVITRPLIELIVKQAIKYKKITIADPKGLDYRKYSGVSLITPNRKEATLAAGLEINNHDTLLKAALKLCKIVGLETILITCGKDGMFLLDKNHKTHIIKAKARQVYDVSGAGDTVLAVLGLTTACGLPFEQGAAIANIAAGIVVGKVGTAPISISEFKKALLRT